MAVHGDTLVLGALSGNTLVVGAPGEDRAGDGPPGGARDSGAVYVFHRSAAGWRQEACFEARETDYEDMFGRSVALWQEHTLVVGAPFSDGAAVDPVGRTWGGGAVYVFRRAGATWQQFQRIQSKHTDPDDLFGGHLALFDGVLAVGALGEDSAALGIEGDPDERAPESGAVYLFH